MLNDYCNGHCQPTVDLLPDFRDYTGQLLEGSETLTNKLDVRGGKIMNRLSIKVSSKSKLSGRVDTPWGAHFGLDNEVRQKGSEIYNRESCTVLWLSMLLFLLLIHSVSDNHPFYLQR